MEQWIIVYYLLLILALLGFVVYQSFKYKTDIINTFINGSFVIQSVSTPYRCLATSNGSTGLVQCDRNTSAQFYRYDRTNNLIVTNASTCLTYDKTGGRVYDAVCPYVVYLTCENSSSASCQSTSYLSVSSASGQTFFYNPSLPIIQNSPDGSGSAMFMNISTTSNGVFMMNGSVSESAYFKCVPNVAFGQWSGRYIKVNNASVTKCLNVSAITVLSNPWDMFNAALSATLTRSSPTQCNRTSWIELDFGRVVPLTQIVIEGKATPSVSYSISGAFVSIADYNNVVNYTSAPIPTDASFTVFNPPSVSCIQSITAAYPISCDMSASLYTQMYPSVTTDQWNHYYSSGKTKGNKWYGNQWCGPLVYGTAVYI